MKRHLVLVVAFLSCATCFETQGAPSAQTATLQKLSADFWNWRARTAPFTGDDVNRIERPGGTRDWSAAAIAQRQTQLADFETKWKALDTTGWTIPDQADYRLLGS